jgi:transposase-like protein
MRGETQKPLGYLCTWAIIPPHTLRVLLVAHEAAIKSYNEEHGTAIEIRKVKYLNNIVEQDHRAVKRMTRPMLGFKAFDAAQATLTGIELMHMIKKKQMCVGVADEGRSAAALFYALAA